MSQVAQVDLTKVKPYGDTLNDGMVQIILPYQYPMEMKLQRQLGSWQKRWD